MGLFGRRKVGPEPSGKDPSRPAGLEGKVLDLILNFPERIDEMETRNEENCRILAREIARLVEEEMRRRAR